MKLQMPNGNTRQQQLPREEAGYKTTDVRTRHCLPPRRECRCVNMGAGQGPRHRFGSLIPITRKDGGAIPGQPYDRSRSRVATAASCDEATGLIFLKALSIYLRILEIARSTQQNYQTELGQRRCPASNTASSRMRRPAACYSRFRKQAQHYGLFTFPTVFPRSGSAA